MHWKAQPPIQGGICLGSSILVVILCGLYPRANFRMLAADEFIRGDVNGDRSTDIADPIFLLKFLFGEGRPLHCPDAADANDSGDLDVSDPILILGHLFLGGPQPARPYPLPGADPTPDSLDCRLLPDPSDLTPHPGFEEGPEFDPEVFTLERESLAQGETSGDPLPVDPETFEALLSLSPGGSIQAVLGARADSFLGDFFGENSSPKEKAAGQGAGSRETIRITAPEGPDGCFRIDPAIIEESILGTGIPGSFRRGDLNGDGELDLQDVELLVNCLAGSGPCPSRCWDAADTNDDGAVNPGDVEALRLAALGELELPPPQIPCGLDPTPDSLSECSQGHCGEIQEGKVQPEVVCGLGPHLVEYEGPGPEGKPVRVPVVVLLCERGKKDCPDSPEVTRDTGDDPGSTPGLLCRWVVATLREPGDKQREFGQNVYDGGGNLIHSRRSFPMIASGTMEVWKAEAGPGPDHALFATRSGANCYTPHTDRPLPREGIYQVRVNLLCLHRDGSSVEIVCPAEAEVEGAYRSRVEVNSSAGPGCSNGPNRVEALSQDEVVLSANEKTLFSKAVSVQTGNQTTISPYFSLFVGGGFNGRGISANAGVQYGSSTNVLQGTGHSADLLSAFANEKLDLPLTISLIANGKIEIVCDRRTEALARCSSRAMGVWLVARTICPVEGPLFLSGFFGEEDQVDLLKVMAEQFRLTRLGR